MSYDLMVFDTTKAPKTKVEFMKWYEKVTQWDDDVRYDDPVDTSSALQNWYNDMRTFFPAMNGPDAASDEEMDADEESGESRISDYCIARDAIYVSFAWSQCENAYEKTCELAKKHGVGFFDVSGTGNIILPDEMV